MAAQESEARIAALQSRPGRVVFTETGEPDAWIATSLTVDVQE